MPEKHELSLEEFDVRVSVEDNGEVWISFHTSGKCVLTMNVEDLGATVNFTETHGQVEVVERA